MAHARALAPKSETISLMKQDELTMISLAYARNKFGYTLFLICASVRGGTML